MENTGDSSKGMPEKGISRRNFVKMGAIGVSAAVLTGLASSVGADPLAEDGKRWAMVIDLQNCTGCGGCMISCKNENNVQAGVAWSSRIIETHGIFPNVRYSYVPTLCNHCAKAPCVKVCPTKAMHKGEGDITAHDPEKCIGCKRCQKGCPYGVPNFNKKKPHADWRGTEELIAGATDAPAEIAGKTGGNVIPFYNPTREKFRKGSGLRKKGIMEKCTFCDHRVTQGKLPYCVLRCPAKARVFGDLNDPDSAVSKLLGKFRPWRREEHLGTEPKVYYVREFNPGTYKATFGEV